MRKKERDRKAANRTRAAAQEAKGAARRAETKKNAASDTVKTEPERA